MQKENYILEMEHITKKFPGVIALDDVEFKVRPGTVHALVGENGAGKSTVLKMITGVVFLGVIALVIRSMVRDKKNGKSLQCGGDCKNCGGHCS